MMKKIFLVVILFKSISSCVMEELAPFGIQKIEQYFKDEEQLIHKEISIYGVSKNDRKIINSISSELGSRKIFFFDKDADNLNKCNTEELKIYFTLPKKEEGLFKIAFRSLKLKNVQGSIELKYHKGVNSVVIDSWQVFTCVMD